MRVSPKKKFGLISIGIALFLVVFISLLFALKYYFYSDDYSMLYHLQNNITPQWPYGFVPLIYKPVYKLFGLMPEAYALLGVFTYFLVTFLVYLLYFALLRKKLIAFFGAALFATGYIGLDQFTQLAVSTVNNLSNIFICIALLIYLRFIRTKKKIYYFLCLLIFILTMVVFPFRVFPLLLFMPTVHALLILKLNLKLSFLKPLFFIIFFQIPFLMIAYFSGVFSYGSNPEVKTVVPNFNLWKSILLVITPEFLSEIPIIIGKFIIPEPIANFVLKTTFTQVQYFLVGLFFISVTLLVSIFFYSHKKYQTFARGMLVFLVITIGGYIGNLIILPNFDSNGAVNRYLSLSFIGYSALFSTIAYVLIENIFKKLNKNPLPVYVFFMTIVVVIFSVLSISYEKNILSERSIPSRNFYRELLGYVPGISNKTIFFFDNADYYPAYSRFGSIMVGAYLPREATLAVHYRKNLNLIIIPNSFNDFKTEVEKFPNQDFYTFYYDEEGLHDTTEAVSKLFANGGRKNILDTERNNEDIFNPEIKISVKDAPSLAPYKLNFFLKAAPLESSFFNFPYTMLKSEDSIVNDYKRDRVNKSKIFEYLDSRRKYYDKTLVTVSSSHTSGMHTAEFLTDDRTDTYWLDDQSSYAFGLKPWIEIDLGEEREISKLLWTNESEPRRPKEFRIEFSKDKKKWEKIKIEKRERLAEGSLVEIVTMAPVSARFLKLHILNTEGLEPGFSEIEVIDNANRNVDLVSARRIKDNPFEYISNNQDLLMVYEYLKNNSVLTVQTLTNREKQVSSVYDLRLPIVLDGFSHEYSLFIPPRGLNLKEIIFKVPFPAKIDVSNISIEYLPIGN